MIRRCVSVDGGFGYFEFCDAFAELEKDGNIDSKPGMPPLYALSPEGKRAAQILSGALPAPILQRARLAAAKLSARLRRDAVVKATHETAKDGTMHVHLGYMDGDDPVICL